MFILLLCAFVYLMVAFLAVVNHMAKDMIYYWEHGDDYTPEMRSDALGAITGPALLWPAWFLTRGFTITLDRASYWLAVRNYGRTEASYVSRH